MTDAFGFPYAINWGMCTRMSSYKRAAGCGEAGVYRCSTEVEPTKDWGRKKADLNETCPTELLVSGSSRDVVKVTNDFLLNLVVLF